MEKSLDVILEELHKIYSEGMKYHEEFLISYEQQKKDMADVRNTLNQIIWKLDNNIYGLDNTQKHSIV